MNIKIHDNHERKKNPSPIQILSKLGLVSMQTLKKVSPLIICDENIILKLSGVATPLKLHQK